MNGNISTLGGAGASSAPTLPLPGVPDLATASAIDQTAICAFSAYERWAPSLAAGGGGRGLRAGRGGPSSFSPAPWSLAWAEPLGRGARGVGDKPPELSWLLWLLARRRRSLGCWRTGHRESPPSKGSCLEIAVHLRGNGIADWKVRGWCIGG